MDPIRAPLVKGSRADETAARKGEILRQRRAAYAAVDARDRDQCRVCGRRVFSHVHPADAASKERHHLVSRRYEGSEDAENIITLCRGCHAQQHVFGVLRLSGTSRRLVVERNTADGWEIFTVYEKGGE